MKHVVTCQANAASDWLTLAALKYFTEWAGLCAMKAALIWYNTSWTTLLLPPMCPWTHRPNHTGPTTAISEHVHVGYRCIYRHDLRVHMWALQDENNNNFDFFQLFPLELRDIFLLACECFVGCYILFHIHYVDLFNTELNECNEYR